MTDEERTNEETTGQDPDSGSAPVQEPPAKDAKDEDNDERAKKIAAAKAKAAAAAKAKAAATAKAKAAAGEKPAPAAKKAGAEAAEAKEPEIPDRYRPLLDALAKEFPDLSLSPQYNIADDHLYLSVPGNQILSVGQFLRDKFHLNYLRNLSGVDWQDRLQVVYHLVPIHEQASSDLMVGLLVDVDRDQPQTPSVVSIWPTANWHEREAMDLFGIQFQGHPNPTRILLPENWQGGYPLRKDFVDKRPKKQRKVRPR